MNNEHMLNVPLKQEVKKLLAEQADNNGRAMGREAAKIIERDVLKRTNKK